MSSALGAAFDVDEVLTDVDCADGNKVTLVAVVVAVVAVAVDAVVVVVVVDVVVVCFDDTVNKIT